MAITSKDLTLLYQIEIHCEDCIRSTMYFDVLAGEETEPWKYFIHCLAKTAIVSWCKVFASNNEPTHFSKFFDGKRFVMPNQTILSSNSVRNQIFIAAGLSEKNYKRFWKNTKNCRDKYFVHNEFTASERPFFPDFCILRNVSKQMRKIIFHIVANETSEDNERIESFRNHMRDQTNNYDNNLHVESEKMKNILEICHRI